MTTFWIIVADQYEARVYETHSPKAALVRVKEIESELGRAMERELGTDRPGRVFSSATRVKHAFTSEQSAKARISNQFAKVLVSFLSTEFQLEAFDELILVAEPKFLGTLKKAFPKRLQKVIVSSIQKNLTHSEDSHISQVLAPVLKELFSDPRHFTPRIVA